MCSLQSRACASHVTMKVIILGAGYGTRLAKDLATKGGEVHSHLAGLPKPLLPIGGKPLISHWMKFLLEAGVSGEDVFVVTNAVYHGLFLSWAEDFPGVHVLSDGTCSNEARVGAVADLALTVTHFGINDTVTIIGGDTLFKDDFSLEDIWGEFSTIDQSLPTGLIVCVPCTDEDTQKYGIVETDDRGVVVQFLEKPPPAATKSRKASTCFYILSSPALSLVDMFLQEKQGASLKERDAPGNLFKYLSHRIPIHSWNVSGRYDVGSLQTYLECCQEWSGR